MQIDLDVVMLCVGDSLQASLVLLDLGLTAGIALRDELGQMLTLGLHGHAIIVAAVVHPLGHVAAAGRVVSLHGETQAWR